MLNWLAFTLAGLMVGFLIFRITLDIDLHYRRSGNDDLLTVRIWLLKRFLAYSFHVPCLNVTEQGNGLWIVSTMESRQDEIATRPEREKRFIRRLISIYFRYPARWKQIKRSVRYFQRLYMYVSRTINKRIRCVKLQVSVSYGNQDAEIAGWTAGMLWALFHLMLMQMGKRLSFAVKPYICISPVFGRNCLEVDVTCILRLTVGDVISTSISVLNYWRRGVVRHG